jgi:hypothetical protein
MKVPYRLRRRPATEPATALLLPSHSAEELARLCARLAHDPLPRVYAVADGLLLKLRQPATTPVGGVIRLRGLADNLLLPVDADLSPGLLPDEAAALTARRGLVFLPGERVLEFDPAAALPPSAWLGVAGLRRGDWQPLPEPPPLADRLTEITLDLPGESPDELLDAGGEGIGTEEPRPGDAGLPRKVLGKAAWKAGKGLSWLGKALGWRGLAGLGARWMDRALNLAPRLSEKVFGRQEASLRDLLRDFREGNVERALRRAVPLAGNDRGAFPWAGSQLPNQDPRYSLRDLLGAGRGPAGVWLSSHDVFLALQQEYRRRAEEAARAGDCRRAAFIYGKLLGDYRQAALALSQGGLHRDAAVLFLRKVGDTLAAAREYEAAGDVDRALQLYRQRGEHALGGDLLRRAGEEELAVAEYALAAEKLLAAGQGHYEAGELVRSRAGRPDLALPYYEAGWAARPAGAPVPCAVRLAQSWAERGEAARLLALVDEAGPYLEPPGNDGPAASFFNEVAVLADRPALAAVRDDLRDRALMGLAAKIRRGAEAGAVPGTVVSALLGTSSAWAPVVVSDARHAVTGAIGRVAGLAAADFATTAVRARVARVTAVCQAPETGEVFLGFESGEVCCFRPASGAVFSVSHESAPVTSLAVNNDGTFLAVLADNGDDSATLSGFTAAYRRVASRLEETAGRAWLCPLLIGAGAEQLVGLWNGAEMLFLRGPTLQCVGRHRFEVEGDSPLVAGLLLQPWVPGEERLLALDGAGIVSYVNDPSHGASVCRSPGWSPALPEGSTLASPPLGWLFTGPDVVELAGIAAHEGGLRWSTLVGRDYNCEEVAGGFHPPFGAALRAVQVVRKGLVVAVTPKAVHWLRKGPQRFAVVRTDPAHLAGAVACFPYHVGNELIVVCADGKVMRVPMGRLA